MTLNGRLPTAVLKGKFDPPLHDTFQLFSRLPAPPNWAGCQGIAIQILGDFRGLPQHVIGSELEDFGKLKATVIFCIASGWAIIGFISSGINWACWYIAS